jgi:hypothetical protein
VRPGGIKLRNIGGIEGRPPIPDLLQMGLIRSRWGGGFLRGRLGRLRDAERSDKKLAQQNSEKALHSLVPPRAVRRFDGILA